MFTITLTMQQSFAAPLTLPAAIPSNNIVTTTSTYEIMFTTATAGVIKTIEIGFPLGYNVGSAKMIERIGIGAGTISANQLGIIYTVTSPVNVASGIPMRLELAGITNTNTAGNTAISITTKNTAGIIIDGPTTASIPIKNIGTRDIADSSVTRPDIARNTITSNLISDGNVFTNDLADNSITAKKVNSSLMYIKSKAPSQPCVGNVGWCPDFFRRHFVIPDNDLIPGVPVVVSLNFVTPPTPFPLGCDVNNVNATGIAFSCTNPPPTGTQLRYIVHAPAQLP